MKLIIAIDQDNAIGNDNTLPWHYPEDLRRFKQLTSYKETPLSPEPVIVMGKNTHKSIGKVLPNRRNCVVTSNPVDVLSGAHQLSINDLTPPYGVKNDAWCIGGVQLYNYVLERDLVDEMYITLVHTRSGGNQKLKLPLYDIFANHHRYTFLKNNWAISDESYLYKLSSLKTGKLSFFKVYRTNYTKLLLTN